MGKLKTVIDVVFELFITLGVCATVWILIVVAYLLTSLVFTETKTEAKIAPRISNLGRPVLPPEESAWGLYDNEFLTYNWDPATDPDWGDLPKPVAIDYFQYDVEP